MAKVDKSTVIICSLRYLYSNSCKKHSNYMLFEVFGCPRLPLPRAAACHRDASEGTNESPETLPKCLCEPGPETPK